MSHWNYRVLKHSGGDEDWYAIHEVYYDDNGVANGYTANEIAPGGDSYKSCQHNWELMAAAFHKPALKVIEPPNGVGKSKLETDDG